VIVLVLLASLAVFLIDTRRWPLVNDPAQIDYACFMVDHGMSPYRDLVEMNMPGIYLVNGSVMHTLGTSGAAWRVFDLLLMALAGAAMIAIALPYDWLAGVFAATLFALVHGRDGPAQTGQRDLIIAVLLLCAFAFLFRALRQHRPVWLLGFGICAAAAATIKPQALLFAIFLLAAACLRLRKAGRPVLTPVLWSIAGMVVPLGAVLAFLISHGSLSAFFTVVQEVLPFYAPIGRRSIGYLFETVISPELWAFLLLGFTAARSIRQPGLASEAGTHRAWEMVLLLCGIGFGVFSYLTQAKGFPYHRYPTIAFVLLWASIQLVTGLRRTSISRVAATAGITLGLIVALVYATRANRRAWDPAYLNTLTQDLQALHRDDLSGHIQCIATAADCSTVLLRQQLVQSTGLFYDYFVFTPGHHRVVTATQQRILPMLLARPPQVIVVDRGLFPTDERDYSKLQHWPEFARFLNDSYTIAVERVFPDANAHPRAYRLYVLKPQSH
jgi:hypothetical protein